MKKGLKYTLVSLGSLVVLAGVGLGIMYGIGERVDLSRFMNGTTIKDLML